jgi:hypothetical protein
MFRHVIHPGMNGGVDCSAESLEKWQACKPLPKVEKPWCDVCVAQSEDLPILGESLFPGGSTQYEANVNADGTIYPLYAKLARSISGVSSRHGSSLFNPDSWCQMQYLSCNRDNTVGGNFLWISSTKDRQILSGSELEQNLKDIMAEKPNVVEDPMAANKWTLRFYEKLAKVNQEAEDGPFFEMVQREILPAAEQVVFDELCNCLNRQRRMVNSSKASFTVDFSGDWQEVFSDFPQNY